MASTAAAMVLWEDRHSADIIEEVIDQLKTATNTESLIPSAIPESPDTMKHFCTAKNLKGKDITQNSHDQRQ